MAGSVPPPVGGRGESCSFGSQLLQWRSRGTERDRFLRPPVFPVSLGATQQNLAAAIRHGQLGAIVNSGISRHHTREAPVIGISVGQADQAKLAWIGDAFFFVLPFFHAFCREFASQREIYSSVLVKFILLHRSFPVSAAGVEVDCLGFVRLQLERGGLCDSIALGYPGLKQFAQRN